MVSWSRAKFAQKTEVLLPAAWSIVMPAKMGVSLQTLTRKPDGESGIVKERGCLPFSNVRYAPSRRHRCIGSTIDASPTDMLKNGASNARGSSLR